MAVKKEFPEWAKILYRGIRASVAAGLAQAWLLKPDWSNLEESIQTVGVAFATGFAVSFGMWLRDRLDEWFGWKPNNIVQKTMPI